MKRIGLICIFTLLVAGILLSQTSYAKSTKSRSGFQFGLKDRAVVHKPPKTIVSSQANLLGVIVKFRENSDVRIRDGQLVSLSGQSMSDVGRLLKPYLQKRLTRLFKKTEKELGIVKSVYEASSGRELADLNLYYRLNIPGVSEAESIINELNKLDIVEIAYPEPRPEEAGDIYPTTPDFVPYQFYLAPAPAGVDAFYAKALPGGDGTGVKIIDIELEWNETHEDLDKALGQTIGPGNSKGGNHGTAVLGEMIAGDNGYGVTGICPGANVGMVSAAYHGTAEAIMIGVDNLNRGDLMLIELHSPGPRYNYQSREDQLGYICMEFWQDVFDALQYAWAKGIIVVEAAGNGAENYDAPLYGQLFDTTYRNSHAIMAGAGAPPTENYGPDRSRLSFSNYGRRVNLQGLGRDVFTTGYGYYWDGGGDTNQFYTATFSGTSSASPIVTGAVACLQGYYKSQYGVPLTADYARQTLNATGSPQTGDTTQHIGPRPNLLAAIPALTPPPSLYSEPIYLDTIIEEGNILSIPVRLYNRSNSYAVDFSTIGNDNLLKLQTADWLDIAPASGTVPAADSVLLTVTTDGTVLPNTPSAYKGIIEISWGASGKTLDSMAYIPVFLTVSCKPDTTFTVLSSADAEGPQYSWIDITGTGVRIDNSLFYNGFGVDPLDDGTVGPLALPYDFPFFGTEYNQIYIGVNGAISFTNNELNDNGYFEHFPIPGNPFSTFISPFWNDLIIGNSLQSGIYYYHSSQNDSTIIEWYHIGNFNSYTDTLTTFEIIMIRSGQMTFQYKDVGVTGLRNTALIGVNAIGCAAAPYYVAGSPAEHMVDNLMAVRFDVKHEPVMAGDANGDGAINILDVGFLVNYLYKGGPAPVPPEAGNPNCDASTNILDVSHIISYLYKSGPTPCYYIF